MRIRSTLRHVWQEPAYGFDPEKGTFGRCYRDMVRFDSLVQYAQAKTKCPNCGEPMAEPESEVPPWPCHKCGKKLDQYFWPERAMTLCTAVHAEVTAIMAAKGQARGSTLYATTFPCFQCAEKISHARIRYIEYTEPYPDIAASERLEIADIETARFEGVRSGRFDEIFGRARPFSSGEIT